MRFEGKTAIITGGSSGIGFAIAEGLVAEGGRVVLVARREDVLAEAADKLGGNAAYVAGDVADETTADRAIEQARTRFGGLDLVVPNAGVMLPGHIADQPSSEVDAMLGTNLRGPIMLVGRAVPAIRDSGAVVIVSSASGRRPMPGTAVYGATKAALQYLVPAWAIEVAGRRIRVNAVCPGAVETPAIEESSKAIPGLRESVAASNLVARLASPTEIAAHVLTLLDNETGGYVTGSIWDVDGGFQPASIPQAESRRTST